MSYGKWPEKVKWPPPLEIHIPLYPSELVPPRIREVRGSDLPDPPERNLTSPFKLTKIDWFLWRPVAAWYEHVKIPIDLSFAP